MSVAEIDDWFRADVLPHASQFRFFARRLCPTVEEAEDLLQEAYVRVLAREDFRRIQCGKAFVRRVLFNLAVSKARRAKIVAIDHIPDVEALEVMDPAPDCYRQLEARQELARLEAAIRDLPTQCRQVVTLRKVQEFSTTEIAVQLGISVSTVEKHLTKGMRRIAATLAEAPQRSARHPSFDASAFDWADRAGGVKARGEKTRAAACAH